MLVTCPYRRVLQLKIRRREVNTPGRGGTEKHMWGGGGGGGGGCLAIGQGGRGGGGGGAGGSHIPALLDGSSTTAFPPGTLV